MKTKLLQRFSRYISFATQSDETSNFFPSTQSQLKFGKYLVEELQNIGMQEVVQDKYGYVTAVLPSNSNTKQPTIGLIAHLDTAPDMLGISQPKIIENYDGNDIVLDEQESIKMTIKNFPELAYYQHHTLLVTDGHHLLGADDKAGIAEIVTALEFLIEHQEFKHGTVKVAFTPDEEIGRGVDFFDVTKFACDFAYTLDGGRIGELEYENFNAAEAKIRITGRNVHPGYAKKKMVNSQIVAIELASMLPEHERPENTSGRQGFFHLTNIKGNVEETQMQYIIREHDYNRFLERKELIFNVVSSLNEKYGEIVKCEINDQYYNMVEQIRPVFHIVERAEKAMLRCGIEPKIQPVRGGTDGANLSFKGLPCPNIFAGGENFHGKYEFVSLEVMQKAVEVIIQIVKCDL